MGTHRKITDQLCRYCKRPKIETSVKNPFIDDYTIECENDQCEAYRDGANALYNQSRNEANAQESRDKLYE